MLDRLAKMSERTERRFLLAAMGFAALVLVSICLWKYATYAYNALDLAIFHQVFWNTVHGRPFAQSIHPHLYLGDHAELIILALAPLYALFQDPRTLLVLQAAAVIAPAWIVYLIARARLDTAKAEGWSRRIPLVLALLWLVNPLPQNVALFEFHILPFALVPLLLAALMYERRRFGPFMACLAAALLVREDVALVVVMFGVLAAIERRERRWWLAPILAGAAWFLVAMRIIAAFAPAGGYKYAVYYAWLGETPAQMAWNALRHPLKVAAHVFRLDNIEMVIGLLLPYAFIPLLRPKRLLLAALPFLQMALGAGGAAIVVDTHYATLFLPALTLAMIDAVPAVPGAVRRLVPSLSPSEARIGAALLVVGAAFYAWAAVGPVPRAFAAMFGDASIATRAAIADDLVRRIPPDAPVAASYALMPHLSPREKLYSLHYVFLGRSQFDAVPYAAPRDAAFAAVDLEDMVAYRAQFTNTAWTAPHYAGGFERLGALSGDAVFHRGPFVLLALGSSQSTPPPPVPTETLEPRAWDDISLESAVWTILPEDVRLDARWRTTGKFDAYALRLRVRDAGGRTRLDLLLPLKGIAPAALGDGRVTLVIPRCGLPAGRYAAEIDVEKADYLLTLNGFRGTGLTPKKGTRTVIGSVPLPEFESDGAVCAR